MDPDSFQTSVSGQQRLSRRGSKLPEATFHGKTQHPITLDLGTYQCLLSAGPQSPGPYLLPAQAGTHGSLVCRNWALSLATPRVEAVRRVPVGLSPGWVSGSVTLGRIT